MIPARLIWTFAFLAFAGPAGLSYAGSSGSRSALQKLRQTAAQQKKDDKARRQLAKQRAEAERLARRLRPVAAAGARQTMRAPVPAASQKTVRVERRDLMTIAERFGGSRGDNGRVSSMRQLWLRRQIGGGPVFGFKTVKLPADGTSSSSTLFAFNR